MRLNKRVCTTIFTLELLVFSCHTQHTFPCLGRIRLVENKTHSAWLGPVKGVAITWYRWLHGVLNSIPNMLNTTKWSWTFLLSLLFTMSFNMAIPSYLIFRIIVWKWCVRSCFLRKNVRQRRPSEDIFPQKAAPPTSLSHYNAKYQITRNRRIQYWLMSWCWSMDTYKQIPWFR